MNKGKPKKSITVEQVDKIQEMPYTEVRDAVTAKVRQGAAGIKEANQAATAPLVAAQQAQTEQQSEGEFDVDKYINERFDPVSGEVRPAYANGSSPEAAINKSPLSVVDRFKMGFGNDKGVDSYLKEKFGPENVKQFGNGDFAVKDGDAWYRTDPDGRGDGDAWEKTKENLKDMADIYGKAMPTAAAIGVSALTAGVGSVGLAGAAAGAMEGIRSSLGRLAGTYEATPEQQLKDVGLEMAISAMGQAIPLGVKPTANMIGGFFRRGAQAAGKIAEPIVEALAQVKAKAMGTDAGAIRMWYTHADEVGQKLISAGKGTEAAENVVQNLFQQNLNNTAKIANEARTGLTKFYGTEMSKIAEKASPQTTADVGSAIKESIAELGSDFVTTRQVPGLKAVAQKAEELGKVSMDEATGFLKSFGADGAVSAEHTALRSRAAIANKLAQAGNISPVADKAGYKILNEWVDFLHNFSKQRAVTGKAGVEQYIKFEQLAGQKAWELKQLAQEQGGAEAAKIVDQMYANMQSKMSSNLSKTMGDNTLSESFAALQSKYANYKNTLAPILDAQRTAMKKGTNDVYTTLYDRLFKASDLTSKGLSAKNSLRAAMKDLGQYAPGLEASVHDMALNKAASAALPWVNPKLVGQGAVAVGAAGLASGNPAAMATLALTSPKVGYQAAKLATSMGRGLGFLQKLPAGQAATLFQDPKLAAPFIQTILQIPSVEDEVKNNLLSPMMGGGGQNGGQQQ